MQRPVVIWGLRTARHSHRYIHAGWYRTLKSAGYDVRWTDDQPRHSSAVVPGSIVLAVNVAAEHLPMRQDCRYVLHNFSWRDGTEEQQALRAIHLQVWSNTAAGELLSADLPCVKFDQASQTLSQPWGTPFPETTWTRIALTGTSRREYWIGSVWNNSSNQGNAEAIQRWRAAIERRGVILVRAPRGWPDTPRAYGALVHRSAFAASIVGQWQASSHYLPCRMFKNLSFGAIPSGNNQGYAEIFGDASVVSSSLEELADKLQRSVGTADRLRYCQSKLRNYTHMASLERMFTHVSA